MAISTHRAVGLIEIDAAALDESVGETLPLAELLSRWMTRTLCRRSVHSALESPLSPQSVRFTGWSRFRPSNGSVVIRADLSRLQTELDEQEVELRSQLRAGGDDAGSPSAA